VKQLKIVTVAPTRAISVIKSLTTSAGSLWEKTKCSVRLSLYYNIVIVWCFVSVRPGK